MSEPARILSGMQPTGDLHIGNYFGALKQWVAFAQDDAYECLFCVVDAHAITVSYEPEELPRRVFDAVVSYLAAGLDPSRVTIFVQSHVPEHMELAWYLASVTPMGDLHRMTQFKEKSAEHKQNVTAALFTYPILMAADVLLYRAATVPVGDDQVQHLELAREICRRFNQKFGEVFVEPQPRLSSAPRIMGVDGKSKMSKSRGNAIGLLDSRSRVEKRIKSAFTDPDKLKLGDAGHPERCNVFTMHGALSSEPRCREIAKSCRSGELGCGACKVELAGNLNAELDPIRARAEALRQDPDQVRRVLEAGAARARNIAQQTMVDVRRAMGLGSA